MSNPVRPHRQQPTRLRHPWDSPGKNTGVGCHFLLQCMKVKSEREVAQSCPTLSDPMDCSPPGSLVHGIFQVRVLLVYQKKWKGNQRCKLPLVTSMRFWILYTDVQRVFDSIYSNASEYIKTNASFQLPNFNFKVKILINKDSS